MILEVENVSCDIVTLITFYILDLVMDGLHVLSQKISAGSSVITYFAGMILYFIMNLIDMLDQGSF